MFDEKKGINTAREQYQRQGIPFPYIPPEMAGQIVQIEEWLFATRQDAAKKSVGALLQELVTEPVDDYVIFGQMGHGINSYTLDYFLVQGPLAIFTQLEWGGAYRDAKAANRVVEIYGHVTALVLAAQSADDRGRLQANERVIVTVNDFTGAVWRRVIGFEEGQNALLTERWQRDSDAIGAALQEFRAR